MPLEVIMPNEKRVRLVGPADGSNNQINVYGGPKKSSGVMFQLGNGSRVETVPDKETDDMLCVSIGGLEGYVSKSFVAKK